MTKFFGKNCSARGKIKLPGGTRFCTLTGVSIGVGIGGIVLIALYFPDYNGERGA